MSEAATTVSYNGRYVCVGITCMHTIDLLAVIPCHNPPSFLIALAGLAMHCENITLEVSFMETHCCC